MKTLATKIAITTAVAATLLTFSAVSLSFADENEEKKFGLKGEKRAEHQTMMKDITRDVEKTDNGVVITMTSENAEAVEKLQNREQKHPEKEGVTHSVENLSNGIRVTVTGADSETVEKIQERTEKGGKRGQGKKGMRGGEKGERGEKGGMMKDVTKSVENTDTGFVMTLTSDDEEVVAKLQSHEAKDPQKEGVTRTVENLANGVQVTVSASDEDTIAKLQDHAEKGGKRGAKKGGKKGGDRKAFRENVTKSVENLENGVVVTLTSDDEEVVEKLQSKEPRGSKNETVSVSKVNIDNGVQITITSTDSNQVERIQTVSDKKKSHRFTQK